MIDRFVHAKQKIGREKGKAKGLTRLKANG
jgi:hypothetical protein